MNNDEVISLKEAKDEMKSVFHISPKDNVFIAIRFIVEMSIVCAFAIKANGWIGVDANLKLVIPLFLIVGFIGYRIRSLHENPTKMAMLQTIKAVKAYNEALEDKEVAELAYFNNQLKIEAMEDDIEKIASIKAESQKRLEQIEEAKATGKERKAAIKLLEASLSEAKATIATLESSHLQLKATIEKNKTTHEKEMSDALSGMEATLEKAKATAIQDTLSKVLPYCDIAQEAMKYHSALSITNSRKADKYTDEEKGRASAESSDSGVKMRRMFDEVGWKSIEGKVLKMHKDEVE
jgi:hypothetical protein